MRGFTYSDNHRGICRKGTEQQKLTVGQEMGTGEKRGKAEMVQVSTRRPGTMGTSKQTGQQELDKNLKVVSAQSVPTSPERSQEQSSRLPGPPF